MGPGPVFLLRTPLRVLVSHCLGRSQCVMDIDKWTRSLAPIKLWPSTSSMQRLSFWNDCRETSWFNTHLHVFFNGLQNFHIELLYRHDRKVHVAEQTVDHLQEGLLHAGEALLQQLWGQRQGESSDTRFYTEAPRSPSTFTTAHFLRKEKKILTTEEGEMLSKAML